jgi:hypothetical protein
MEPKAPETDGLLEEALKRFLTPVEGVPLSVVVHALTGHKVLRWDLSDEHCRALNAPLCEGIREAAEATARNGVDAARPNEVGNRIEAPVVAALRHHGFHAEVPRSAAGRQQSVGYPDVALSVDGHPPIYLEVKTYGSSSAETSFRSFYISPPLSKVSRDAYHLLVAFEIVKRDERYYPIKFRILAIDDLRLKVKHEFNTSNDVIYSTCPVILEDSLSG